MIEPMEVPCGGYQSAGLAFLSMTAFPTADYVN
jgi:hypothetical protein